MIIHRYDGFIIQAQIPDSSGFGFGEWIGTFVFETFGRITIGGSIQVPSKIIIPVGVYSIMKIENSVIVCRFYSYANRYRRPPPPGDLRD
jgi:hypothetical protein